jgi:hypothetical protein
VLRELLVLELVSVEVVPVAVEPEVELSVVVPEVPDVPEVVPVPMVEDVPLVLVLFVVFGFDAFGSVPLAVPEPEVPAVPLDVVPAPALLLPVLLVPLAPVEPVLPVADEPVPEPELLPEPDCAYENPTVAMRDAAAAAMASFFEIWFMV